MPYYTYRYETKSDAFEGEWTHIDEFNDRRINTLDACIEVLKHDVRVVSPRRGERYLIRVIREEPTIGDLIILTCCHDDDCHVWERVQSGVPVNGWGWVQWPMSSR